MRAPRPSRRQMRMARAASASSSFQYTRPMAKLFQRLAARDMGWSETCRIRRYEGTKNMPCVGINTWPRIFMSVDLPPRREPTTATSRPCGTLRFTASKTRRLESAYLKETFWSCRGMASEPKRRPELTRSLAKLSGQRCSRVIDRSFSLVAFIARSAVGRFSSSVIFCTGPIARLTSSRAVNMSLKLSPTSLTALIVARNAPIWMLPFTIPSPPIEM
mmetsp:Transcript_99142/g.280780  ORF Transcript_99142/g.280780 Transcript_99142/m.280780 type:complete len:218 (-) Transcript_99142:1623-2276(-)